MYDFIEIFWFIWRRVALKKTSKQMQWQTGNGIRKNALKLLLHFTTIIRLYIQKDQIADPKSNDATRTYFRG
jgi:hypothetical protein